MQEETSTRETAPLLSDREYRLDRTRAPQRPELREVEQAIETLVAAQAAGVSIAGMGEPGDVFLFYDLTLASPGRQSLRVRSRRDLHGLLTTSGLAEATSSVALAVNDIMRPINNRLNSWAGELTESMRPTAEKSNNLLPFGGR